MKTLLGKIIIPLIVIFGVFPLVKGWYMTPSASSGETAPDFSAVNASGQSFKLSDYRGTPVLLHFWGSWCGPCRRNNPDLVTLAKEQGEQLKVVSIAIEKNRDRWLAAIERDGLFWPDQVFDETTNTKFLNGPISDLYGVNEVPTEFLLNESGEVIQVNPSLAEIRKYLADAR